MALRTISAVPSGEFPSTTSREHSQPVALRAQARTPWMVALMDPDSL